MIKFMVIGLPRSATTWAANWLSTDTTFCLHDPLNWYLLDEVDNLEYPGKEIGISCTGSYLYTDWLNNHPAPKVIVHRDVQEIKESLRRNKIRLSVFKPSLIHKIEGLHVDYKELFTKPEKIWSYLLPNKPLDIQRHSFLKTCNVQMDFEKTLRNRDVMNYHLKEIAK
jgi:hypothetical protein